MTTLSKIVRSAARRWPSSGRPVEELDAFLAASA